LFWFVKDSIGFLAQTSVLLRIKNPLSAARKSFCRQA